MDPFIKSNESILMTADMNQEGDGGLVVFDLPNTKITPLNLNPVDKLKHPGLCKLKKNLYMVVGGYIKTDYEVQKATYIIDIKDGLCIRLPDMHDARFQCECIFYENKVFVISGRHTVKDFTYINQCEYYDLVTNRWNRMEDYLEEIKGVERVFIEDNKIVCIFFKALMSSYDIGTNTWTKIKRFTYDIDVFYISNSNNCLAVNNYYNSVCKYDYFKDTILFDLYIDDFKGVQHFYIQEIDCIVFIDDSAKSSFVVYDCNTRAVFHFNEQQYASIFKDYRFMYTTGNYFLRKPTEVLSENIDVLDGTNVFIYGNWSYPFSLILHLNMEDVTWKFYPIPERLHLKSEQGLTYLQNNKFIFAGGYDDDRSYVHTSDTYAYNPDNYELEVTEPLVLTVGNIILKRFTIPACYKKSKLADEEDYMVFLANENDEPEIYMPKTKKWQTVPSYDFTFLPNILDIETGAVVFYVKRSQDKTQSNTLVFKSYDLEKQQWWTNYEKPTTSNIYISFCYKLDNLSYLVISDEKEKGIMISKMELVFNQTTLDNVTITPLDKVDTGIKGNTVNFLKDGNNLILLYIDGTFKLKVVSFDLQKMQLIQTTRLAQIDKAIRDAFDYLRFTKLGSFNVFSMFCSNR